MTTVVHKNPYDLLGDDDNSPVAAVKAADKSVRGQADAARGGPQGARRGFSGNEGAFRDRNAGHERNRTKPTDEVTGARGGARGGYAARGRGGRGARNPRYNDDRHSKGVASGSEKQAAHGWGATEGKAELKDEEAGEQIAKSEQKDAEAEAGKPDEPAEPEEKQVSYDEYLTQLAEKKLALETPMEARKANEGSKPDKKWASAKPLVKEEEDVFISGVGGKTKRERERKQKQVVEIDQRYVEPADRSRGGGRGGRGDRGDSRGGRGAGRGGPRGGDRGDARGPRGAPRGAPRGGAPRGAPRGTGENAPINTSDQSAFPSLGK